MSQISQFYSQVSNLIKQHLKEVQIIYIFGSADSQYENSQSDLDIAIFTPKKCDSVFLFNLAEEIARLIGRDVDLIDLHTASTVLRFQIVSTGKKIYCQDENFCALFETMVYSMYVRFNDERHQIIDSIRKRGQIYNG